jgi:hypothetical protein
VSAADDRYNHSEKGRARNSRYDRERREKCKAAGLCTRCRKRQADLGYAKCPQCRADTSEWDWLNRGPFSMRL